MARRPEKSVDGVQRRLFDLVSLLGVRVQGLLLRGSFHWWYRKPDPWATGANDHDRERFARSLACLPERPFHRVLDVGCGEGLFTGMLAERYPDAEVLGVDISKRAVARAKSQVGRARPNVAFEAREILNDGPAGRFDLIFCAETLYYLGRDSRVRLAADRLTALLEPGGALVLNHPRPEARRLHQPFDLLLTRITEYEDQESFRPYVVTVYERPAGS